MAVVGDNLSRSAWEAAFPGISGARVQYKDVRYGLAVVHIFDDTGTLKDQVTVTKATVDGMAKAS